MTTKQTSTAPWQELEEQAYHAYREWHLWLILHERELAKSNRMTQRQSLPVHDTEPQQAVTSQPSSTRDIP
jgi:hypothetical protein